QSYAKSKGYPWSISKGFDTFAPISEVTKKEEIEDPHNLNIKLWVNDKIKQNSNTKYMIFTIDQIIEYVSEIMTLERGDIIATGTPEGVGKIKKGDRIILEIDKVGRLENCVT
ncbi:acylpyruvase, partial [Thermococci archaeon]